MCTTYSPIIYFLHRNSEWNTYLWSSYTHKHSKAGEVSAVTLYHCAVFTLWYSNSSHSLCRPTSTANSENTKQVWTSKIHGHCWVSLSECNWKHEAAVILPRKLIWLKQSLWIPGKIISLHFKEPVCEEPWDNLKNAALLCKPPSITYRTYFTSHTFTCSLSWSDSMVNAINAAFELHTFWTFIQFVTHALSLGSFFFFVKWPQANVHICVHCSPTNVGLT